MSAVGACERRATQETWHKASTTLNELDALYRSSEFQGWYAKKEGKEQVVKRMGKQEQQWQRRKIFMLALVLLGTVILPWGLDTRSSAGESVPSLAVDLAPFLVNFVAAQMSRPSLFGHLQTMLLLRSVTNPIPCIGVLAAALLFLVPFALLLDSRAEVRKTAHGITTMKNGRNGAARAAFWMDATQLLGFVLLLQQLVPASASQQLDASATPDLWSPGLGFVVTVAALALRILGCWA